MENANAMMPPPAGPMQSGDDPGLMPAGPPASGPAPQAQLSAQYSKLMQAGALLDAVQAGLGSLHDLGDTITGADVTKVAGELVAKGLDATAMAGMLAEMPEKGEMLAQWVEEHLADIAQREAQLQFVTRAVRQQMGVGAMRGLMMQYAENGG